MQMEGATELEKRVLEACHLIEAMPASEAATKIVVALSDAGSELQRLRALVPKQSDMAIRNDVCIREVIDAKARDTAMVLGDRIKAMAPQDQTVGALKRDLLHAFSQGAMFALTDPELWAKMAERQLRLYGEAPVVSYVDSGVLSRNEARSAANEPTGPTVHLTASAVGVAPGQFEFAKSGISVALPSPGDVVSMKPSATDVRQPDIALLFAGLAALVSEAHAYFSCCVHADSWGVMANNGRHALDRAKALIYKATNPSVEFISSGTIPVWESSPQRTCSKCCNRYSWRHCPGESTAPCPACGHDECHAIVNEALASSNAVRSAANSEPSMTWEDKFAAMQELVGPFRINLSMRKPGDWYVNAGAREIGYGGLLQGKYGNGRTPEEAVEEDWRVCVTSLKPNERIVIGGTTGGKRREVVWGGTGWVDSPLLR